MIKQMVLGLSIMVGAWAYGHEGHDIPGSLPPAPHGGKVAEVEHEVEPTAKDAQDYYLEAKLEGNQIKIYPLVLDNKNKKIFKAVSPSTDLQMTELKLEMPRAKQAKSLVIKTEGTYWVADVGEIKERRILVHSSISDKNLKATAKIQIER